MPGGQGRQAGGERPFLPLPGTCLSFHLPRPRPPPRPAFTPVYAPCSSGPLTSPFLVQEAARHAQKHQFAEPRGRWRSVDPAQGCSGLVSAHANVLGLFSLVLAVLCSAAGRPEGAGVEAGMAEPSDAFLPPVSCLLSPPLCSLLRRHGERSGPRFHVPVLRPGQPGPPSAALPVVETASHCPAAGEKIWGLWCPGGAPGSALDTGDSLSAVS